MSPSFSSHSSEVAGGVAVSAVAVPFPEIEPVHRTSVLFERSPDAEAVFAGEEEQDWPWAEMIVPIECLPSRERVEAAVGGSDPDDLARVALVEQWIDQQHGGSMELGLEQSPLVLVRGIRGMVDLVDGWHRLLVAHRRGVQTLRAVVVYEPEAG